MTVRVGLVMCSSSASRPSSATGSSTASPSKRQGGSTYQVKRPRYSWLCCFVPEKLDLFVVGFGRPDLLREQVRLLTKYLQDPFEVCLIDNTPDEGATHMEAVCRELGVGYLRSISVRNEHDEALNFAALHAYTIGCEYWGTLDHDIFPSHVTSLLPQVKRCGFYGVGQRHAPTASLYLWPGFCFFSRKWLANRVPNFNGIRGEYKRDDGDCGSMLSGLFQPEDWERFYGESHHHGYGTLRAPDDFGLQSWGYEEMGDGWVHLTNASGWKMIPNAMERDQLALKMIQSL